MAAGNQAIPPIFSVAAIAGMSNDHTAAATITPDANPNNVFCIFRAIFCPRNKALDAPNTVPMKGNKTTIAISKAVIISSLL